LLGIFSKSMNKEGAIAGMVTGLVFTSSYIIYYKFLNPAFDNASFWIGSISPEGIGFIGMLMNFFIAIIISRFYPKPPKVVSDMVTLIRQP
ncbi:MAG: hypothetical protein ABS21_02265, partial [SAR86 cluster bacterium BACL1 MAG-121105-bin34]